MKSNVKKKLGYSVNMCLILTLILLSATAGQALISADRTIDKIVLSAGESTNATVVIQNDNVQRSLSLKETIPTGWILTKGIDDSSSFKPSTNEWVWFTVNSNEAKTVKYKITVPSDASPGSYNINGVMSSTTDQSTANVKGNGIIEVVGGTENVPSFTFGINPPTITVNTGVVAKYNLTISNTGSAADTYGITTNKASGSENATVQLSKNSVTIGAGNSSVVELSVSGSSAGTYVVNATAKSSTGDNKTLPTKTIVTSTSTNVGGVTLVANPSSTTVSTGTVAKYNLTVSNTGSNVDTYNIIANKSTGSENATVQLSKNSVTVAAGNSSVVELSVSGSVAGTYVVNAKATSSGDVNKSASAMITTTVTGPVIPVLSVENLTSVPSSTISKTNPAKISANVKKGDLAIELVDFGIVDVNNLLGKGVNTVLMIARNVSGAVGLYKPENWPASYVTLGNAAVTDVVTINVGDESGLSKVRGMFKANKTSNNSVDAVLSFNRTTGNLSDVSEFGTGKLLTINSANSTFQAISMKFSPGSTPTNGNFSLGEVSTKAFTLYSTAGNVAVNNPRIVVNTVSNGKYKLYALAKDANGTASQSIDIDTMPSSSSSSSSSSSGGGGGSGDGTYPTITDKPKVTATANATATLTTTPVTTATVVETKTRPLETVSKEEPIDVNKKGSPGFSMIVVAIGIIAAFFILRRVKK